MARLLELILVICWSLAGVTALIQSDGGASSESTRRLLQRRRKSPPPSTASSPKHGRKPGKGPDGGKKRHSPPPSPAAALPPAPSPVGLALAPRTLLPFSVVSEPSPLVTASVAVSCAPSLAASTAAGTGPAGGLGERFCAPLCAEGFTDASAKVVCASLHGNEKAAEYAKAGKPIAGLAWAAGRTAVRLACGRGAAALVGCEARLLAPGGCASFATVDCGAPVRLPPPPPPAALPPSCAALRSSLAPADLQSYRTDLPHGTLFLAGGALPARSGVVQLSWCGVLGSVSMKTTKGLETTAYDGPPYDEVSLANRSQALNVIRAALVCRKLGYEHSRYKKGSRRDGGGSGLVWDMRPACRPGLYEAAENRPPPPPATRPGYPDLEVTAKDCPSFDIDVTYRVDEAYPLSVECFDEPSDLQPLPYIPKAGDPPAGSLRLMNQTTDAWLSAAGSSRGFVQVYREGRWGSICSSGWDDADAEVACRQLGFAAGSAIYIRYDETRDEDNGGTRWRTAWMTDVGYSRPAQGAPWPRLLDCPHRGPPITDCPFTELAAVRCYAARANVPPPPPPSPRRPRAATPYPGCSLSLHVDLSMDAPLGKDTPIMGEAMCDRLADLATVLFRTLDTAEAPPLEGVDREGRPAGAEEKVPRVFGFDAEGFRVPSFQPGTQPRWEEGSWLPSPFACSNYTDRTMTVTGALDGARPGAARYVRRVLSNQTTKGVTEWILRLRDALGLLQPCQTFDTDYDYMMMGARMTPDVTFAFCDGPPLLYPGMDGVNTLVRSVWSSPPPDAPWDGGAYDDGFNPPEADTGVQAPPPPRPSPPRPRPSPPRLNAATNTTGLTPANATLRGCFLLPADAANRTLPSALLLPLANVTGASPNLTLASCASRVLSANRTLAALEAVSFTDAAGRRLVTMVCYGVVAWPLYPTAATELPWAQCGTALLKSRQQEREAQVARRKALEASAAERSAEESKLQQRLWAAQERLAQARRQALQRRGEAEALQPRVDDGARLASLRAARRALSERSARAEAAAAAEAGRCASFAALVGEHAAEAGAPVRELEGALAKLDQRMAHARSAFDLGALGGQLGEAREARREMEAQAGARRAQCEAAAAELEQLRAALAVREAANVEAVERSQAALREARAAAAEQRRLQAEAQRRLAEARSQRLADAGRLAELQRGVGAAQQTLEALGAPAGGEAEGAR
ncbi:hypothetical protein HYH03_019115 [Edaphochlamys debaryana]|uniref:SRCR domain-containing protein n=1 Tax=Edaphochlamys debaryana TaxID=47281 RepID=A0A835XFA8_9CHLO|nr:hypothetical protein HYH03_019115 [Edaphochlamys debaryana]|eukprot:KAG2481927.1 hypothetical protein HYH03_019115 [Edaphochlamys debaryana]